MGNLRKDQNKELLMKQALAFYQAGWPRTQIGRELNITPLTVGRWLKKMGVQSTAKFGGDTSNIHAKPELPEPPAALVPPSPTEKFMEDRVANMEARQEEVARIEDIAEAQGTPADQYQAWAAQTALRLMRDAQKHLKRVTTVKDLDLLDRMARRNLGLDNRRSGGGGLHIDVNILTDERAAKGRLIDANNVIEIPAEDEES